MSFRLTILLLLFISAGRQTRAQLAPAPDAPPEQAAPSGLRLKPSVQRPTFHATVNFVELYFTVRGLNKKLIDNLTQNDCAITEDNTPQAIKSFTADTDQPLTLGVLLDTSVSQQRVLPTEQRAAAAFLHRVLRPKDEAVLIAFDVDVTMLSDFTSSAASLKRAIDTAHVNSSSGNYANGTIPSIGKPRGTLLYDAIYLAAQDKLRPESGRKALVLLTDGVDEGSRTRLKAAIEAAEKADAIVYILLIEDAGIDGAVEETNAGPMQKLAKATGGQVFKIGSNGRKMQAAFEEIGAQLRTQYQAAYTPTNSARDGTYRSIHITCRQPGKHLHVQARQGYYAEPSNQAGAPDPRTY